MVLADAESLKQGWLLAFSKTRTKYIKGKKENVYWKIGLSLLVIVVPTFFQILDTKTPRLKTDRVAFIFIFHTLTVVLSLEKWAYSEIFHVVYCHVKPALFFLTVHVFGWCRMYLYTIKGEDLPRMLHVSFKLTLRFSFSSSVVVVFSHPPHSPHPCVMLSFGFSDAPSNCWKTLLRSVLLA